MKWISVDNSLPGLYQDVLVAVHIPGGLFTDQAHLIGDNFWVFTGGQQRAHQVIAWMLKPPPPNLIDGVIK